MTEAPPRPLAQAGTAGRISATFVEGVHLRLELFALEMRQERDRIVELVVLRLVMALAAVLLLLSLQAALLVVFWESHRILVAVGMVVFYTLVVLTSWLQLRRRGRAHDEPFAASTQVLGQDVDALRGLGKSS